MKLPGKGISWKQFAIELKNEYKNDRINDAAGALTFFGVLALFPFLLFLVSLASVIIQPQQAEALVQELGRVAPEQATGILSDRLRSLGEQKNVGLLSISIIGALWAASGGVVALMRALNVTYDVQESRPFWKVRAIALAFVIGGGLLGLLATLAMVALPAVANAIGGPVGTVIRLLRFPVAAVLVMFVWAVAYYVLPDVKQKFRFLSPGSVVGVLIWLIASFGFSVYVSNFGKYDATYGSLGGVIVMLLWMWISAQVLLLGAEINALIEHHSPEGKAPGEKREGERAEGAGARPAPGARERLARERGPGLATARRREPGGTTSSPSHTSMRARAMRARAMRARPGSVSQRQAEGGAEASGRRTAKGKALAIAAGGAVMGAALMWRRRPA